MMQLLTLLLLALLLACAPAAQAQADDRAITDAREALRKGDKPRLAALRQQVLASGHPLAQWVDYWDLSNRLKDVQVAEVGDFYARWSGTYVEDRLRNDWLLELGRRRDWAEFSRDFPRFRMNDDREVTCYHLLTRHLAGQDVREAAREAWYAQRDADDGCQLLGATLYEGKKLSAADVWQEVRLSVENNRPRAARAAAGLISAAHEKALAEIFDNPARYLTRRPHGGLPGAQQLLTMAVLRMAANDAEAAAGQLEAAWARDLTPDNAALAWAFVARQHALRLAPEAVPAYQRAWSLAASSRTAPAFGDEALAWQVRAALRTKAPLRWALVQQAIGAMSAEAQADPAWVYWLAKAQLATAAAGEAGEAQRAAARARLDGIASPLTFYGQLAIEDQGGKLHLPPAPPALSDSERTAAAAHPGLQRALRMIAIGLRPEGVREWNFSLRGMDDRSLLAAAQLACDREVWDRCINTSERSRNEIHIGQRYPTPLKAAVIDATREAGVETAYVYGLIRQESRFIMDARSHVGASGLMQLMPATARWTARKVGIAYTPEMITDRDINLKLGTTYLRLLKDDFGGSAAMAAAAYNAGPGRPRRWREGAVVDAAAWIEGIPFNETRDYVKKVLSNTVVYTAVLGTVPTPTLKPRLGGTIGPRDAGAVPADKELP